MARKIRAKLIIELREQGVSRRAMASTRHMSTGSACEVFDLAAERRITWGQVRDMPDNGVYRLFYPGKHARESAFEDQDRNYARREMAKVGVDLRLLHDEYRADCVLNHKAAIGYTKFCDGCGNHAVAKNLATRIKHKSGVSREVGWSGPVVSKRLVNPVTGGVSKICLFVGVLSFNQKAYFESTLI